MEMARVQEPIPLIDCSATQQMKHAEPPVLLAATCALIPQLLASTAGLDTSGLAPTHAHSALLRKEKPQILPTEAVTLQIPWQRSAVHSAPKLLVVKRATPMGLLASTVELATGGLD